MSAINTPPRAFLVVRHGTTDWNREGRFQGLTDNPINDDGLAQAFAVARRLRQFRIEQIVTSPLTRAVKTAEILAAASGAPIAIDNDIIAFDYGYLEGESVAGTMKAHNLKAIAELVAIMPPDSEPWTSVCARAMRCVVTWLNTRSEGTVLFVTHDLMMQALSTTLCGKWFHYRYGSPYRYVPTDQGWVVDEIL